MSKAYKVVVRTIPTGDKKGQKVFTVVPVSYGTLTTDDVAKQISAESTATPGDVNAVLDRYAYNIVQNLKKGYSVEMLGFGTMYLRFIKEKGVDTIEEANASMIKAMVPAFRPSYNMINNTRVYSLTPEKISLVKYGTE